jgi:hypothetical protein
MTEMMLIERLFAAFPHLAGQALKVVSEALRASAIRIEPVERTLERSRSNCP